MMKVKNSLILAMPFCLIVSLSIISCTPGDSGGPENEATITQTTVPDDHEKTRSVTFEQITGTWKLMYRGNYGYEFRFYPSYKAIIILYLRTESLLFKGVYTIETDNIVRININEMKRERRISGFSLSHGFAEAKSSYFQFDGSLAGKKNAPKLILKPVRIIIDGNSSDGYFEPVIKLGKIR